MSEGSSIVDEEGSAEPWRGKLRDGCNGRITGRGEITSFLRESSSCESQPGACGREIADICQERIGNLDGRVSD